MIINREEAKIVCDFIKSNAFKMMKAPTGVFKYPIIDPGAGYEENLWDWDSYWSAFALRDVCKYFKNDKDFDYSNKLNKLIEHSKGIVLNFLDFQLDDGFIPMVVTPNGLFSTYLSDEHKKGNSVNQHKPFLCQQAFNASEINGSFEWLRECTHKFEKYVQYFEINQYDTKSGLFFWENDIMIGIDNNPAVYARPNRSVADIYLNCFMYNDLLSLSKIFDNLGNSDKKTEYLLKAELLSTSIRKECYDVRDGLYYGVDIKVKTNVNEIFNHGLGAFWNSIPIKIRTWASFLPMYCGIATKEEAEIMVQRHYNDPLFNSPFGIRTLSADEKMYNTENTSNPSNWLGAIWIVSNYCIFKGLLKYNYIEEARAIASKTITLLSMDISKNGCMSESYIPETGKPMMYGGFLNWDLLVISMLNELNYSL